MGSERVLVVDDEEHILELARLYLSREGYQVESVADGGQALTRFGQLKPDLVVLDIMLPGKDGLTICREIRKQSQVPIIMLTARDEVTDKVVGLERGAGRGSQHRDRLGRRLPARDQKHLSLRFRLLIAAAGIVVVSLVLSGALTWVLVRNLEFDDAHLQLDRLALLRRAEVLRAECLTIPSGTTTTCPGGNGRLASRAAYEDRLRNLAVASGADRMLLVAANRTIVFDSAGSDSIGTKIVLGAQRKIDQGTVNEGNVVISGQDFIGAGVAIAPRRDPDGAAGLVFARTVASINSLATGQVVPRPLVAGLAALLLALAIALLLSRAFARPLSELAGAAEEIAAGNYAARVGVTGRDEIGVVGRSFNRMAEAVERARATQRDFLANVSHELKTPLTSLLGFSQALIDGSLQTPAERTRAGTIIHEEAHRVLRMSQELLDLARVESGQISLHPTDVDLKALLEQEIEIVKPRAGERQLALDLRLPTSPPP